MIILVGPSASGKTEVAKILIKDYGFKKFVTTTTRQMRVNEINDVDYHFISLDEFHQKMANNEFIETVEYNGNFYGTYKSEIDDNKVLIVEPNGLSSFLSLNNSRIVSFYIDSPKELRKARMESRQDKKEDISKRLALDDVHFKGVKAKVDKTIKNLENTKLDDLAKEIILFYNSIIK